MRRESLQHLGGPLSGNLDRTANTGRAPASTLPEAKAIAVRTHPGDQASPTRSARQRALRRGRPQAIMAAPERSASVAPATFFTSRTRHRCHYALSVRSIRVAD